MRIPYQASLMVVALVLGAGAEPADERLDGFGAESWIHPVQRGEGGTD